MFGVRRRPVGLAVRRFVLNAQVCREDTFCERPAGNGGALPNPLPTYATIVPEHHRKNQFFEYIFNYYGTYASIFDYPKSVQQFGTIDGDGGQGCTNVLYGYGKKIFWNVGGNTQITEYQVPQTPIKTLSVTTISHPAAP